MNKKKRIMKVDVRIRKKRVLMHLTVLFCFFIPAVIQIQNLSALPGSTSTWNTPAWLRAMQSNKNMREAGYPVLKPAQPPSPSPLPEPEKGFDISLVELDVILDPVTGDTTGTLTITATVLNPHNPAFYLYFDQGLTITASTVHVDGVEVVSEQSSYPPWNWVTVSLSPAMPSGQEGVFTFEYEGTLQCDFSGARGSSACNLENELKHFLNGGPWPHLMDGREPYGHDIYTFKMTLHTPSGENVLVSGNQVETQDDGTTYTSVWEAEEFASWMNWATIYGNFNYLPVQSAGIPYELVHLSQSDQWAAEMQTWTADIAIYLDDLTGYELPFDRVSVVKLPHIEGFPGTASHSMVYLAETYSQLGEEGFEELLFHEISHLWWGVLTYPSEVSMWLIEGPAILYQYDYTADIHHADVDRDLYLAGRHHNSYLMVRYLTDPETLQHLVLDSSDAYPSTLIEQLVWAYYKSSAVLDHLRVSAGEDVFDAAWKNYLQMCSLMKCDTGDLSLALEIETGADWSWFFEQWVYDTAYPRLEVDFSRQLERGEHETTVVLRQDVEYKMVDRLELELWLNLEDGSLQRERVALVGIEDGFLFSTPYPVRSVFPSPRHNTVVWSRSAILGDVNFDMEVDGEDLLRCAQLKGRTPLSGDPEILHIYAVDEGFDPLCDLNDNQEVDEEDLEIIIDRFGEGVTL